MNNLCEVKFKFFGCSRIKNPSSFIIPDDVTRSGRVSSHARSYGGSAKTILYLNLQALRYALTSIWIGLIFSNFISSAILFINEICLVSFSTRCTTAAPLEANSKLMLPVPENRSSTLKDSKSTRFERILKRLSRAKSVVGLAIKVPGGFILLPLYFPPIIRNLPHLAD